MTGGWLSRSLSGLRSCIRHLTATVSFQVGGGGSWRAWSLKQRFAWDRRQMREYLPDDYPTALGILCGFWMRRTAASSRLKTLDSACCRYRPLSIGMGWTTSKASLDAMPVITRHTSCEGAIRPYIIHHPQATLARLHQWALDENEHVRRLVSEGSRPRLPWWPQLTDLIADPTPSWRCWSA